MSAITWLHISDLHIRSDLKSRPDYGNVLRKLLQDVKKLIEERDLQPDFVAVTGDLTARGQAAEFDLARDFLDDLLEIVKLDKGRLFVVPGNHDVDRQTITGFLSSLDRALYNQELVSQTLADAELRKVLFRRQVNFFDFCNEFLGVVPPLGPDRYYAVHSFSVAERQVVVLGLNSAYTSFSDRDRNQLWIGTTQVIKAVNQAQAENADLVFALMHHPLDWLHDRDRGPVMSLIREHCQILLHGHTHVPDIWLEVSTAGETLVVPAGATLLTPDWGNSYNFARLDLDTMRATIYLRRWSSERYAWGPDPFGDSGKEFSLSRPLSPLLTVRPKPQLPPDNSYFVGREQETAQVLERLMMRTLSLTQSSQPSVTTGIWGMSGIGKTCLALHLAHSEKVQERFPDGVLWADLSKHDSQRPSVEPMNVLGDWAAQLGVDVHSYHSLDSRADAVRRLLVDRRCLCVLDNAKSSDSLTYLLPTSGGCAAIVTSQNLEVVAAFDSNPIKLTEMTPEEAEQLFRRVLGDERVDAEMNAVRQIADTLSHLPIALDLIASKLASERKQKLADIACTLADLRKHFRDPEDRFPHVWAGFQTAFEGLSTEQRIRFRRLAVFGTDSFDASAVAALGTGDRVGIPESEDVTQEGLDRLRQLSLVELVEEKIEEKNGGKQAEKRRWSLHSLLLYYASAELEKARERNDATFCAGRYFCDLAKQLTREGESDKEEAWPALEALRPHISRSLTWYREQRPKEFVRYVLDIFRFYYVRGYWEEAEKRLHEALSECQKDMAEESALLRKNLSLLHYRHGRLDEALALLWEALNEFVKLDNKREQASILIRIGWIYEDRSCTKDHYDNAIRYYEQARDTSGCLPEPTPGEQDDGMELVARAQHQIANVAFLQGDYPTARRLYEHSIKLKEALGNRRELSKGWRQLAMVEREQGNLQRARELLEDSLEYENSMGEHRKLNICLTRLALVKAEMGICRRDGTLLAEALDHAYQANQFAKQIQTPWGEANACYAIGFTYLLKGQWDQAEEHLKVSRARREDISDISRLASSHLRLGQLAELRGDASTDELGRSKQYNIALGHYINAHEHKAEIGDKKHAEEALRLADRVGQKLCPRQAGQDPDQVGHTRWVRIRLECAELGCDFECRKCGDDFVKTVKKMDGVTHAYQTGTARLDARLHVVFDSRHCTQDAITRYIKTTRMRVGDFLVPYVEASGEYEDPSIDYLRSIYSSESTRFPERSEQ